MAYSTEYLRGPSAFVGSQEQTAPEISHHPLLAKERDGSSVRPLQLGYMLYGGRARFERSRYLQAVMEADPVFDRDDRPFQNHTQRYLRSSEKMAHFHTKCREMGLTDPQEIRWAYTAIDEVLPTDVHMAMVIPALQYQTSKEQRERWLDLATSFRILGAYVQTELGHGSNVRGIETTATFDQATQEFVLHSPTLTSTKWWPGGLGKTATHCILMAQLITSDGQGHGVHPFFVQLRSMTDHTPLPGITIGDIGPKLGFNSTDNGFCRFDNVRTDRTSMLMGVAEVAQDGSYRRVPGGEKQSYGAMLDVRASLVIRASTALGRALTIAMRFSAVRTQGYIEGPGVSPGTERQVLDYPTQQHTLFPLLALAYALHFSGSHMARAYHSYLETQDATALPDLHATSSGLKALVTQTVADGIEALRKMCGGHGFSQFSGLPEVSSNYLALATLEGTQQVLEPQTARHLIRAFMAGMKGKHLTGSVAYLSKPSNSLSLACGADLRDPGKQLCLFQKRALAAVEAATEAVTGVGGGAEAGIEEGGGGGKEAMVRAGVELGRAARAHCQLHLLVQFSAGVERAEMASKPKGGFGPGAGRGARPGTGEGLNCRELSVLGKLRDLFALSTIEKNMGDFLEFGVLERSTAPLLRREVGKLCLEIRPEAVTLVDAWHFTDKYLGSVLGRNDGQIYTAMMEAALAEPLNESDVVPSVAHVRKLIGVCPNPRL